MLSVEDHLDSLVRHINLVRDYCILMGKKLIRQGRVDFARKLVYRGFSHDLSKFQSDLEWNYMHVGNGVDKEKLSLAIKEHHSKNSHHVEYHESFDKMSEIDIYEMVADWASRSQEFTTCLKQWIEESAIKKYNIDKSCIQYSWMMNAVNLLLEDCF